MDPIIFLFSFADKLVLYRQSPAKKRQGGTTAALKGFDGRTFLTIYQHIKPLKPVSSHPERLIPDEEEEPS
jgi:hypothetical protein